MVNKDKEDDKEPQDVNKEWSYSSPHHGHGIIHPDEAEEIFYGAAKASMVFFGKAKLLSTTSISIPVPANAGKFLGRCESFEVHINKDNAIYPVAFRGDQYPAIKAELIIPDIRRLNFCSCGRWGFSYVEPYHSQLIQYIIERHTKAELLHMLMFRNKHGYYTCGSRGHSQMKQTNWLKRTGQTENELIVAAKAAYYVIWFGLIMKDANQER